MNFPGAFDPLSAFERAKSLTVRSRFQGLVLDGVKSDGTMDMLDPPKLEHTRVRFVFNSSRGDGPQPPHALGEHWARTTCGRQDVLVDHDGIAAQPDDPRASCKGMNQELPDPRCGLKAIWDKARERGAPADGVAFIEYYNAAAGPAWRFAIPGTQYHFELYGDCERELTGAEAVGNVPR